MTHTGDCTVGNGQIFSVPPWPMRSVLVFCVRTGLISIELAATWGVGNGNGKSKQAGWCHLDMRWLREEGWSHNVGFSFCRATLFVTLGEAAILPGISVTSFIRQRELDTSGPLWVWPSLCRLSWEGGRTGDLQGTWRHMEAAVRWEMWNPDTSLWEDRFSPGISTRRGRVDL